MTSHHDPSGTNQDRPIPDDEPDAVILVNTEPTHPETDPLAGQDPEKHPAPRNQPWRKIAEEINRAGQS